MQIHLGDRVVHAPARAIPPVWVTWAGRTSSMHIVGSLAGLTALLLSGGDLVMSRDTDMSDPARILWTGTGWAVIGGDVEDLDQYVGRCMDASACRAVRTTPGVVVWSGLGATWDASSALSVAAAVCQASVTERPGDFHVITTP
ncbi:hypothetical protein [Cellulomonas iranensis]|uniref:hypothetical protein n=1 Tax=Cellulomonas iranensis TaxID=76862 RepID=UPI0013D17D5A|nr:hypothetical protein [Cellulomonas iranensis]